LGVAECNITDIDISRIVHYCICLDALDIRGCRNIITPASIRELQQMRYNCEIRYSEDVIHESDDDDDDSDDDHHDDDDDNYET
jgi:hypothetical protein